MTVEKLPLAPGMRLHPDRKTVLTASEIGAAAGVDPYKPALTLQLEKMGLQPPSSGTPQTDRGIMFEPVCAAYVERDLGWRIVDPRCFLVDRERRIGCTPDRLLEDPDEPGRIVNCQLKVVGRPQFEKWDGEPPLSYQLQVTQENMLLDAAYGLLAVLVMTAYDAELELFTVPRNEAAEAKVCEIARAFWERIEKGVLPPADYAQDGEVLARLYPPSKDVPVPLDLSQDNRIYDLCEDYEKAQAAIREGEARKEAIKNEITEKLKGAELALATGWKITRVTRHVKEYVKAAYDYPDMRIRRTKEAA